MALHIKFVKIDCLHNSCGAGANGQQLLVVSRLWHGLALDVIVHRTTLNCLQFSHSLLTLQPADVLLLAFQ